MEKQFVTTGESPRVVIEMFADLRLKGWDESQVTAKTDSADDLILEQQGDDIYVRCHNDCKLLVPRLAHVVIKTVQGDATIKGLEGTLNIESIDGDLVLHGAGPTTLNEVRGDLSLKNISGNLEIRSVHGNTSVRDVQGNLHVEDAVYGNLSIKDISGSASAQAKGNLTATLDPAPGEAFNFTASGNIFCGLPGDVSVAIHIEKAGRVSIHLPGVSQPEGGDEPYDVVLGDGDATLTLAADGNITVGSQAPDWSGIGEMGVEFGEKFEGMSESIAQQIEAQVEMMQTQLDTQLEGLTAHLENIGLSQEQQERIAQRSRQASERATVRMQEKMRRMQEKLDRKLAEAQRRADQKARAAQRHAHLKVAGRRMWDFPMPPTPPTTPEPPGEAVSDEERLTILRMLEEKKITLEEADNLLSALEGKGS